ncbi:MAG: PAS domain-containing protein [Flavipsychrobacter sp.]
MFKLKYFWPYILFFCTIAILVFANRVNIKKEISRNLEYTKTLNVAGKQRMLSQKLTKLSLQAQNGEDVSQAIKDNLEQWKKAHFALENSSDGVNIYEDGHPEVLEKFKELTPYFQSLYAGFEQVAEGNLGTSLLNKIRSEEQIYLPKMDNIVATIEQNAADDLERSANSQKLLALFSGLLLVIEMIVFVYPYHKRLVNMYKKVKKQQEELEEQKQVIESLYETNELIITGTKAGVWEWDIMTGEENWSDRFFEVLGYERGDIPSTYDSFLNILLHPEDKDKILNSVDQHLKKRTPYKHEVRMLNKNGTYRWYETSGQAIWNKEGEPIRMAGSIIDVTDRVSTREKLLSVSNSKDKLLSIITHDLRTPINNLKGLLELLKENVINKEEFLEHLQSTSNNVTTLSDSMNNMLEWAQTQLSGWEVAPSDILVSDVVEECIRLYKYTMDDKHIKLEYSPSDLIHAYADFNQMVLIVRNVLNNAVKFTPENGVITIDTNEKNGYAEISVRDTGQGMDEKTVNKILNESDIFTTRGTNGEKGTGLGMKMCLEFAEKNNCKFNIVSEKNVGTEVSLSIPKLDTAKTVFK